jgi:hypothetical protein
MAISERRRELRRRRQRREKRLREELKLPSQQGTAGKGRSKPKTATTDPPQTDKPAGGKKP